MASVIFFLVVLNCNILRALRENQYYNVKLKSVTLRTNTLPDAKKHGRLSLVEEELAKSRC